MGNPPSPIVVNVFMSGFEEDLLLENSLSQEIKMYRYLHDIFCAWSVDLGRVLDFLSRPNSAHDQLLFTVEVGDQFINFLDVQVSLVSFSHPSVQHF